MAGFTKGEQNAANLGDYFDLNELIILSATGTTGQATVVLAAPGFIPEFVITSSTTEPVTASHLWAMNGTTGVVTFTRGTTAAPVTFKAILGDLS